MVSVLPIFCCDCDRRPLYDIERGRMCAWYSQFPSNAQHIIDKWNHVGGNLETVSYQTATKFSIYFPSVSN